MEISGEVRVQTADGKWIALGHTAEAGILHIPETTKISSDETDDFEEQLMKAMTEPLDSGSVSVGASNPVEEIVDEKLGGHMAKKVSAHADPKYTDGVWTCPVCQSESSDKQIFEEAGEWEECAKSHAKVTTGEEKDALGRYVAGAEAKQNLDRATRAIKDFRDGMQKLGLSTADLNIVMDVMAGEFDGVTPEDVNRLTRKFPELKPALSEVEFPEKVLEELKPLRERQWHQNLMLELWHNRNWYGYDYTVADRVMDFYEDVVDFWADVFRRVTRRK